MNFDSNEQARNMGIGIAIGIGTGAALFVVTVSPVFIGVGVAMGVAIGAALGQQKEPSPQARRLMLISFAVGVFLLVALTIIYFFIR